MSSTSLGTRRDRDRITDPPGVGGMARVDEDPLNCRPHGIRTRMSHTERALIQHTFTPG